MYLEAGKPPNLKDLRCSSLIIVHASVHVIWILFCRRLCRPVFGRRALTVFTNNLKEIQTSISPNPIKWTNKTRKTRFFENIRASKVVILQTNKNSTVFLPAVTLVPEAFIYSLQRNFATQTAFIIFVIAMKRWERSHRFMAITKIIKAVCVAKFRCKE